jgi:hypothetical protein
MHVKSEAAEVPAADIALISCHAADIVRVLPHQVGVEHDDGLAHLGRVFLVDAEYDRLGEAVGVVRERVEMFRDRLGSGEWGDDALEIIRAVFVAGNLASIAVEIALSRSPAGPRHSVAT